MTFYLPEAAQKNLLMKWNWKAQFPQKKVFDHVILTTTTTHTTMCYHVVVTTIFTFCNFLFARSYKRVYWWNGLKISNSSKKLTPPYASICIFAYGNFPTFFWRKLFLDLMHSGAILCCPTPQNSIQGPSQQKLLSHPTKMTSHPTSML